MDEENMKVINHRFYLDACDSFVGNEPNHKGILWPTHFKIPVMAVQGSTENS
jgi:hypothetical protein